MTSHHRGPTTAAALPDYPAAPDMSDAATTLALDAHADLVRVATRLGLTAPRRL